MAPRFTVLLLGPLLSFMWLILAMFVLLIEPMPWGIGAVVSRAEDEGVVSSLVVLRRKGSVPTGHPQHYESWARRIASCSATESEIISWRTLVQPLAVDGLNQKSRSSTLSVGPPEAHTRIEIPQAIASTGTIPKCSFIGVYSKARVLELRRRAVRW